MTDAKGKNGRDKRSRMFTVRLNEHEADIVADIVERTGLSAGALVRRALLDAPTTTRRPSAQERAAQRLLASLGKIGSNVHQLAGHADTGVFDEDTTDIIRYVVRDLSELRFACMQALGYEATADD